MWSEDRARAERDRLACLMIPFLCERTGWSVETVQTFLDALNLFWRSQWSAAGLFDREEDDDGA